METLILQPKTKEQLSALKAIAKAFKIDFKVQQEVSERDKAVHLYGNAFVEKIENAEKAIENGDFITLDPDKSLWENIL